MIETLSTHRPGSLRRSDRNRRTIPYLKDRGEGTDARNAKTPPGSRKALPATRRHLRREAAAYHRPHEHNA
jgi:hypothetical protein